MSSNLQMSGTTSSSLGDGSAGEDAQGMPVVKRELRTNEEAVQAALQDVVTLKKLTGMEAAPTMPEADEPEDNDDDKLHIYAEKMLDHIQ